MFIFTLYTLGVYPMVNSSWVSTDHEYSTLQSRNIMSARACAALTGHFAHAENLNKVEILFTKIFVPLSRKYLVLKTDKHVVSQRYRPATSSS